MANKSSRRRFIRGVAAASAAVGAAGGVSAVSAQQTGRIRGFDHVALPMANTDAMLTEMWYAPDVKQWVKIREVLSNGVREREMVSFKLN